MKFIICLVISLVSFAISANAAPQVYTGCSVPAATPNHIWYFDPVNGSATGDGSQGHPWNSLQAALSDLGTGVSPLVSTIPYRHYDSTTKTYHSYPNPNAPIKPGDEILLMSGNYGAVTIGSYNLSITNSDFITIAAVKGQTPVFTTLYIFSTNMWLFNGIKVQSLLPSQYANPLVYVKDQGASYPTSDIIFETMLLSSQDNVSAWSQAQWQTNARGGLYEWGVNTSCISVTGSHMLNVTNGAVLAANKSLFVSNQIDHFGNDGIDYAGNNLLIRTNYIHDNIGMADGVHTDAMQGQNGPIAAGVAYNQFSNIIIDSNTIIRQIDPTVPFTTYLQGIDAFNEDWTNITVTNNVIITSACWGIYFASIHNGMIANNTVLNDGLLTEAGNCAPQVAIGNTTSEGPPSTNSILRNNLAMSFSVYSLDAGVSMDHNICVSVNGGGNMSWYVGTKLDYFIRPGTYANYNIVDSGGVSSEFLQFSPSTLSYTVMLKAGAPAITAGVSTGAPTVDILGNVRTSPYTVGAYAYPF
jgi:hypothetical protein